MYYILNFENREFVSCDNATETELKIRDLLEDGCSKDSLEIINGVFEDVRLNVDEFRKLAEDNGLFERVYIYPKASNGLDLDNISVSAGIVEFRTPSEEYAPGCMSAPLITIRLTGEYFFDGSFTALDNQEEYYDRSDLYSKSYEEAIQKALELATLADKVKALPRFEEPSSSLAYDYFEVVDIDKLSDLELIEARDLAKMFVGPQAVVVARLGDEMEKRFVAEKKTGLDEVIEAAAKQLVKPDMFISNKPLEL